MLDRTIDAKVDADAGPAINAALDKAVEYGRNVAGEVVGVEPTQVGVAAVGARGVADAGLTIDATVDRTIDYGRREVAGVRPAVGDAADVSPTADVRTDADVRTADVGTAAPAADVRTTADVGTADVGTNADVSPTAGARPTSNLGKLLGGAPRQMPKPTSAGNEPSGEQKFIEANKGAAKNLGTVAGSQVGVNVADSTSADTKNEIDGAIDKAIDHGHNVARQVIEQK